MAQTRTLGPNPGQTADDLAQQVAQDRSQAATTNYAPAYAAPVQIDEATASALADAPGRAALQRARQAAVARRDAQQVGEIDSLLNADPNQPPPTVSAGTLDRVRIAMDERAGTAARRGANDTASGLRGRSADINTTLDNVPEMAPARADFRAKSQAIDVLGKDRKDVFSTDPGDYGKWLQSLSLEARQANQVAIRQEILDTLGGQRSSTFGSVDELATSEYAKANLRQALGAEADPYLAHLDARLQQARNAGFVSPNAGSRTAVLENDLKGVVGAAKSAVHAVRGGALGMAAGAAEWLMSRGVSEGQAQAIAKAAVDPAQTERVLRQLEGRFGKATARQFLSHISRPALTAGALGALQAGNAAPPSPNQ
jgi:hypothetical protein